MYCGALGEGLNEGLGEVGQRRGSLGLDLALGYRRRRGSEVGAEIAGGDEGAER